VQVCSYGYFLRGRDGIESCYSLTHCGSDISVRFGLFIRNTAWIGGAVYFLDGLTTYGDWSVSGCIDFQVGLLPFDAHLCSKGSGFQPLNLFLHLCVVVRQHKQVFSKVKVFNLCQFVALNPIVPSHRRVVSDQE